MTVDAERSVMESEGVATGYRSPRWRRMLVRVIVGFVAFLLVGNGLILGTTAYLRWTTPDASAAVSIDNFRQIDAQVFRGAAPGAQGLRELAELGVVTVVDLRAEADLEVDDALLEDLGITRHHLPTRDGQLPTEAQAAAFLEIVEEAQGPVFVHCGAGVGRTGAMTAFYLNATGQTAGTGAMRRILAVGPPSLEQIAFAVATVGGDYERPGATVTAVSRVLDAPRRIWHNLT